MIKKEYIMPKIKAIKIIREFLMASPMKLKYSYDDEYADPDEEIL